MLNTHLKKRRLSEKFFGPLITQQLLSNNVNTTDSIRSDEITAKEKYKVAKFYIIHVLFFNGSSIL